jgi:hypothetical protein
MRAGTPRPRPPADNEQLGFGINAGCQVHVGRQLQPYYKCPCGQEFDYEAGKYGCPNCEGDNEAELKYRTAGTERPDPAEGRVENILHTTCKDCGHHQDIKLYLPMPVNQATAILSGARCECCGSKELAI